MFDIGFTEILVVALVSIIVLDKNKVPVFIDLIKTVYRYIIIIKSKIKKLLKDAGIEDLYKECNTEEVSYIAGKNGKLYPAYNINSKDNRPTSKPVYGEKSLEECTTEYSKTTKLPSEIEFQKRSNDSEDSSSR